MPQTTLASNLPCSGFLFGLFLASLSSNVQSDSLRLSFWTFSVPHTTLTSNPPRVDFSFGLLLASRSSNVQPDVSPTRGRTSVRHKGAPPSDTNAPSGHHDNKISSCKSGALSPPVLNERVNANLVPLRGESSESVPNLQELILFFTSLLLRVRPLLQEPEFPTVLKEVRLL